MRYGGQDEQLRQPYEVDLKRISYERKRHEQCARRQLIQAEREIPAIEETIGCFKNRSTNVLILDTNDSSNDVLKFRPLREVEGEENLYGGGNFNH